MAIPETQLDTWSHQGAMTQSKDTYATVKRALESDRGTVQKQGLPIVFARLVRQSHEHQCGKRCRRRHPFGCDVLL